MVWSNKDIAQTPNLTQVVEWGAKGKALGYLLQEHDGWRMTPEKCGWGQDEQESKDLQGNDQLSAHQTF